MVNQPIRNHMQGISGKVRFHLWPPLQGQTRIDKFKSAYNSLIIVPRGTGNHGL